MIGDEIRNNPDRRCKYCKGREIIIEGPDNTEISNLNEFPNRYTPSISYLTCKDPEECKLNQISENTIIYFYGDEKGKIIKRDLYYNGDFMTSIAGGDLTKMGELE